VAEAEDGENSESRCGGSEDVLLCAAASTVSLTHAEGAPVSGWAKRPSGTVRAVAGHHHVDDVRRQEEEERAVANWFSKCVSRCAKTIGKTCTQRMRK